MIKKIILIFGLIIISISSCIKWDLEKVDIISFNFLFNEEEGGVGYNYKNDIIQNDNDDYLIIGKSIEGAVLVMKVTEDGAVASSDLIYPDGEAKAIVRSVKDLESYVTVGNTGDDLFVMNISASGGFEKIDTFKNKINAIIGLVEEVRGNDIIVSKSGEHIITGSLKQQIGDKRLMFLKLDDNKEILTFRTFNANTEGYSIKEDLEGDFVIGGYKEDKLAITKVSSEGVLKWQKTFAGTSSDSLTCVEISHYGNYIIIGSTSATENVFISELNKEGEVVWEKEIDIGEGFSRGYYISKTRDSSYIFGATNNSDLVMGKIDLRGDLIWERKYQGDSREIVNVVSQTHDFGFISFSLSNEGDSYFFRIIKTDENGEIRQ